MTQREKFETPCYSSDRSSHRTAAQHIHILYANSSPDARFFHLPLLHCIRALLTHHRPSPHSGESWRFDFGLCTHAVQRRGQRRRGVHSWYGFLSKSVRVRAVVWRQDCAKCEECCVTKVVDFSRLGRFYVSSRERFLLLLHPPRAIAGSSVGGSDERNWK